VCQGPAGANGTLAPWAGGTPRPRFRPGHPEGPGNRRWASRSGAWRRSEGVLRSDPARRGRSRRGLARAREGFARTEPHRRL
jgi:hypothetical protein